MNKIPLGRKNSREVELSFDGEDISTDGGLLLIDKIDDKLKLIEKLAHNIEDNRDQSRIHHSVEGIVKQRVYGLIAGHEDLNDHEQLRQDTLYQALFNTDKNLASASTICRLERTVPLSTHWDNQNILIDAFIDSHEQIPESITLDFDPTDTTLYGDQESKHYHGYYNDYCYLPLIVTCGHDLLVAHLRPSNIDGAKHVWAILSLLVKRIKAAWPSIKITFRADSGLCRHRMLNWCEKHGINYIVGLPGNNVLLKKVADLDKEVKAKFEQEKTTQKEFTEFDYQAGSWKRQRRVICKVEHNGLGRNIRYVVTNIKTLEPEALYCDVYCQRGDMENRIKEYQIDMFGSRLSCSEFAANQFRMFLSAISYVYLNALRKLVCAGSKVKSYCRTLRLKLIKAAVIIRKNTRKIYLQISKSYPYRELFVKALNQLLVT